MKLVKDFIEGDNISTQLLVSNVTKGVNSIGAGYLNVELRDSSGAINAKKWEVTPEDDSIFVIGNIVEIGLEIINYRNALQGKIVSVSLLNNDDIDVSKFIKQPPVSKEELTKRFLAHVNSIKNSECKKVVEYFINKFSDKLYTHPAASSIHHEYSSGLLMHEVSMCDIAVSVEKMYNDVSHDLLISGIILHDLGKTIELEGPVAFKYTVEGKLLGHISIMAGEIRSACKELKISNEITTLLEHMVLSHHGNLEFGSPVLPQTKEAMLLSLIDNMDSKMTIIDKALETVEKGEFSQKIFALDNRCIYKHNID